MKTITKLTLLSITLSLSLSANQLETRTQLMKFRDAKVNVIKQERELRSMLEKHSAKLTTNKALQRRDALLKIREIKH